VLSVVVAIELLGTGEPGVGALMAAVGVGAVLGSLAASLLVAVLELAEPDDAARPHDRLLTADLAEEGEQLVCLGASWAGEAVEHFYDRQVGR
jgi:hypothetical protein